MDGDLEVSLDKLPIKRPDAVEENGSERFPPDVGYDEKNVQLIRRIDFAWAVEREEPASKKQKKASSASKESQSTRGQSWQWQSLVENLQLAHQELSVIIDLINTVEANDAVTVAGMTRPKQLPNEHLSDLAVSTANKLQCFRHLGKYLKQSAKALDKQIAREARFYGALIRLQQNWKVKRLRTLAAASANEGFYIDLFDNSLNDPAASFRPTSISTVRIDHDSAGMLTVNMPPNSCRSLQFGFLGSHSMYNAKRFSRGVNVEDSSENSEKGHMSDDDSTYKEKSDDDSVRETHTLMREVHRAIADEQVFDLVNREAFNPSIGVDVAGIQEDFLRLNIAQSASVSISLVAFSEDDSDGSIAIDNTGTSAPAAQSIDSSEIEKRKSDFGTLRFPNQTSFEIYLRQIFHEHVFVKAKKRSSSSAQKQISNQTVKDGVNLLGHFCSSLAHRIFSNKVLAVLESLVCRLPYVQLTSHFTWHSRLSSWVLSVKVPQTLPIAGNPTQMPALHHIKNVRSEFRTKVLVNDDCISVEGEGAPDVVHLFKGKFETSSMNQYSCDLADLPVMLLQQIASQIVKWLHEEALAVGMKANRDFLSVSFEIEPGEVLSLVSHVDPEDAEGCISWWLVMEDGFTEETKVRRDTSGGVSDARLFLGYPSLNTLHSILLDSVGLCRGGGIS